MNKILFCTKTLVFAALLSLPVIASAQYGGSGWNTPATPPKNKVPLDGGLSLLVLAGAGYGVKRFADSKKKNNTANK